MADFHTSQESSVFVRVVLRTEFMASDHVMSIGSIDRERHQREKGNKQKRPWPIWSAGDHII